MAQQQSHKQKTTSWQRKALSKNLGCEVQWSVYVISSWKNHNEFLGSRKFSSPNDPSNEKIEKIFSTKTTKKTRKKL